jgi:hypothetical protein
MTNMKTRVGEVAGEKPPCESCHKGRVTTSEEGMKRILFEKIGEKMTERP